MEVASVSIISASDSAHKTRTFHFWNGDEYTGEYAVKDNQKVREGKGIYKTSDGEIYEGIWVDDCLTDECKIVFADESRFSGTLERMKIEGLGTYKFPENIQISGDFEANRLVGRVHLTDPNSRNWSGNVNIGDKKVYFYPVHPFWQSVLSLSDKDSLFYESDEENGGESEGNSENF